MIFAPLARLVAVVAVPVRLPVTLPTNVVAVTIPVNLPDPVTVNALVAVVVPIPTNELVCIPVTFFSKYPCPPVLLAFIVTYPWFADTLMFVPGLI